MAADWIKLEKTTPDKPEIHQMATVLGIDPDAVLGKVIRVWAWLDGILKDCHAQNVTSVLVDRIAYHQGFADAMTSVGWLDFDGITFSIPNFERHMSKSAKNRALATERKRLQREGCDTGHEKNVTPVTVERDQRREEKRINTPIVPKGTLPAPPKKKKVTYSEGFLLFWAVYPRKVGKADAFKKWKRLKCDAIHTEIIASVQAHMASADWKKDGGEFIPHPATYLNQGRWEDELESTSPKKPGAVKLTPYQGT